LQLDGRLYWMRSPPSIVLRQQQQRSVWRLSWYWASGAGRDVCLQTVQHKDEQMLPTVEIQAEYL
ncbi:hypothetical protein, partial [Thermoleptolyngbya sp. M55_K2018_002]|uniref:hypothetical protein n=1 Tax=Thermoleptolyngbya sp. M55_K2018_002 TaxID=2747808 RepID=UPI0025D54DEF